MIVPGSFSLIGVCGFAYLILALQVNGSFPPFYKMGNREKELKLVMPLIFSLMGILVAAVVIHSNLFILFGLVSAWCGVRVRRMVQKRTNGPLPWLLNPLTIGVMNRWPMLLFDAWTIGLAALMGLVMLL
jgi:hypothetical protein